MSVYFTKVSQKFATIFLFVHIVSHLKYTETIPIWFPKFISFCWICYFSVIPRTLPTLKSNPSHVMKQKKSQMFRCVT